MEEKEIHDELTAIRGLMERSSKFISLSGLSGILAGVYALIGAGIAFKLISDFHSFTETLYNKLVPNEQITTSPVFLSVHSDYTNLTKQLFIIALIVLILSITTAFILSRRQAKRKGQALWGKISQSLLFHMATPLITGGLLVLIFVSRGYYGIIAPCSLIFYGLSLVSAGNFTFNMVKYLGLFEILLGLIAACFPGYGLLFWAFGFGVLHIIYGSMMYLKYDR